ncbi:transforming acidic coiled-coil-containing protein 3-like [Entelurus aequoreus]|uniref:transforming acidic coiled-coil-containing protein 3-like n=1 Tax=Entelurus aequoreus TaxID=161455 RepID=UPI002B1E8736|nr:transforming acidic coiled-coil-containing protein 3-like [Entelurus aequoreus]
MSVVEINDENCGVCPGGGKHSGTSDDIFAQDQPTGRPSILRQTENLPSKTVPKGIKVCFQTPRRDPMTKRIMSPTKLVNTACVNECTKAMESLNLDMTNTMPPQTSELPDGPKKAELSYPDDDMPIQSKGDYQLDFDNLDNMNPFQSSNKMVLSPPRSLLENSPAKQPENIWSEPTSKSDSALDETLPFAPTVENSLVSSELSSADSSVVIMTLPAMEQESRSATPDVPAKTYPNGNLNEPLESLVEDAPLPSKGSYNFDVDNIDLIDPFKTEGSKIQNSPVLERKSTDDQEMKQIHPVDLEVPEVFQEMPVHVCVKPIATVAPIPSDGQGAESKAPPTAASAKQGPIKLDFNFDDGGEVKPKTPPKRVGKRPSGLKPNDNESDLKAPGELVEKCMAGGDADVGALKAVYSLDFEKLDDPNFKPFGTTSNITNSPKSSLHTSSLPAQEDKTPVCANENIFIQVNKQAVPDVIQKAEQTVADLDKGVLPKVELLAQQPETCVSEFNQEFVPGTEFMANNFEEQIDYLEQFGSCSFKESALRKQSLYLKFDPLLRESPKKSGGGLIVPAQAIQPTALVSRFEMPPVAEKEAANLPQKLSCKLTDDITAPTPQTLANLGSSFSPSANIEDIIEVLKYSQKDMDAAIAKVQAEAKKKEEEMCAKYKTLHDEGQEMRKIIAEFELIIAKMIADQEKEREVSQGKLNEAHLEKKQIANDLNNLERSFSELFKRLEKYKEVIDGYKKNEETLKACAQDYLVRIKKEEQRYHTLKAHAEEKISHANEEIAEVRSKYKAEVSALQVKLRWDQLKAQSLEKNLDQKMKEVEDLTKLCDDLISQVQKG